MQRAQRCGWRSVGDGISPERSRVSPRNEAGDLSDPVARTTWIAWISAALFMVRSVCSSTIWPEVVPVHKAFTFVNPGQGGTDTPALLFVISVDGDTAYKLECHNVNYDHDSEMTFSGDFQCALFALKRGGIASANLLADSSRDQQTSDWLFNRGRLLAVQLWGPCGTYAEYGRLRNFVSETCG